MKENYQDKSTEELKKDLKNTTLFTYGFAGILVFILISKIVSGKNFWGVIAVPLALSPFVFINFNKIKELKNELKNRS